MSNRYSIDYRWLILALSATTFTFVVALPFSCMPVLFKEISEDLGLSLVQIGTIWGIVSLSGIFVSLPAGLLGDKFSVKYIIGASCLLAGIAGGIRGLSGSFVVLLVTMFLYGILRAMIPINTTKTVGLWFKGQNLGLANGVISMGMGLGLMLGPLISATLLSPLLGGWRNVLILYGGISVLISLLWFFFGREPDESESAFIGVGKIPVRQALSKMLRLKALWLIGFTLMFRFGSILGMSGYLPLYLRERGWTGASADNTLATFYAFSTVAVIPFSSLSDRIGSRKIILLTALIVTLLCFSLLPIVDGIIVWILMITSGMLMDAFMSAINTTLLETEGVGPEYSGTALGIVFSVAQLGGVISPPLGNSLADFNPGLPFIFWAALSLVPIILMMFVKETGWRAKKAIQS